MKGQREKKRDEELEPGHEDASMEAANRMEGRDPRNRSEKRARSAQLRRRAGRLGQPPNLALSGGRRLHHGRFVTQRPGSVWGRLRIGGRYVQVKRGVFSLLLAFFKLPMGLLF